MVFFLECEKKSSESCCDQQKNTSPMECTAANPGECRCQLDSTWVVGDMAIYPQSKLLMWKTYLMRFPGVLPGLHKLNTAPVFHIFRVPTASNNLRFYMRNAPVDIPAWAFSCDVDYMGFMQVWRLQRWWRRVLERKYQERALAVMMGTHERLGESSWLGVLDEGTVCICIRERTNPSI